MNPLTAETAWKVRKQITALPEDASAEKIESTAQQLEKMNFEPILLISPPDFLRSTKQRLVNFFDTTVIEQMSQLTEQHLSLLVYQYRLLQALRRDEAEAWDEINELMEDD
jgi:hypothetical protein